jgi:protein-S-isoprenylcysteine O-methyltransferase Ste14
MPATEAALQFDVAMSETDLILASGTAILSVMFGIRVAMRAAAPRPDRGEARATGGAGVPDVAGVIALPPLIFLGFLATAAVLEAVLPLPVLAAQVVPRYLAGAALAIAGFVIIFRAAGRFQAAGTNIPPNLPATALVVDGIYRRTRNPFYLGMTLVYLGVSVAAGSVWAIGLVVPLVWVINTGVIAREERYLERKFGDAYRAYKARVRQWV